MSVERTTIEGLLIVRWPQFEDDRGFFKQTYQANELADALGRPLRFSQGNHSRSQSGVLRGFHKEPWDKLIYVTRGTALCVVADTRPESPTFGQTIKLLMGDPPGERARIFVSRGLSNAFYCFSETDYLNDVSEEFDPADRAGVAWDDPILNVDWPNPTPVLSYKDASLPKLRELFPEHPLVQQSS